MFTEKDIEEFYRILDVEIADFDCGKICAERNRNKIPYCCDISKAVPILYEEEYDYLRRRTDMWKRYRPKSEEEKLDELDRQIYAECKGPSRCKRKYRSLVCRNFPTYPYFDENGNVIGLFLNAVLADKCYLANNPQYIRGEYIQANIKFWNLLFSKNSGEKEFHIKLAHQTEKRYKRLKKKFIILTNGATPPAEIQNEFHIKVISK